MTTKLVFEGRCWKFGDHIPTDMITPTHIMFKTAKEMAAFVAQAAKALQATDIGAVVAELFSRTFYRNGYEIGPPRYRPRPRPRSGSRCLRPVASFRY